MEHRMELKIIAFITQYMKQETAWSLTWRMISFQVTYVARILFLYLIPVNMTMSIKQTETTDGELYKYISLG